MQRRLPTGCPSCGRVLEVQRLTCPSCTTAVEGSFRLPVLARLSGEEQQLVLHFIACGGSLKDVAAQYGVSYPTVRNRLDSLIVRLQELSKDSAGEDRQ